MIWVTRHFRHYLYGHKCLIYTDHQALKALLNTPHPSGKLARWGLTLDAEIVYRPGKANNADTRSRNPVDSVDAVSVPGSRADALERGQACDAGTAQVLTISHFNENYNCLAAEDTTLVPIIVYLETGEVPEDGKLACSGEV